jgi:deoxyadenosine/deoxycytidine kinase
MESPHYIVVEGVTGVGKGHLAQALVKRLGARLVADGTAQNPFLQHSWRDRRAFAFVTQVFFLLSRYRQQREIAQGDLFARTLVSNYLFERDRIFAYLTLSDAELALYEQLYRLLLREAFPRPDLVVYLQASTDTLLDRLKSQGKLHDKSLSHETLEELNKAYNTFFFNYTDSPLLVVNTNDLDLARNEADMNDLVRRILETRSGTQYYSPGKK